MQDCVAKIVMVLLAHWAAMPPHHKDIIPLLECMSSLALAVGQGFLPWTQQVFTATLDLLRERWQEHVACPDDSEPMIMVTAIDLLSGSRQEEEEEEEGEEEEKGKKMILYVKLTLHLLTVRTRFFGCFFLSLSGFFSFLFFFRPSRLGGCWSRGREPGSIQ